MTVHFNNLRFSHNARPYFSISTLHSSHGKMASLAMIDYGALAKNDDAEIQKLVQACQTEGIFYLDLYGPLTEALLEDVLALLQAGHEFFSLPPESDEKTQSLRKGMERG